MEIFEELKIIDKLLLEILSRTRTFLFCNLYSYRSFASLQLLLFCYLYSYRSFETCTVFALLQLVQLSLFCYLYSYRSFSTCTVIALLLLVHLSLFCYFTVIALDLLYFIFVINSLLLFLIAFYIVIAIPLRAWKSNNYHW